MWKVRTVESANSGQTNSSPIRKSMSFTTESGISNLGKIPWGSHFCHVYENAADLAEVLIPYFATGLQNNERCIWIASEPYFSQDARKDLAQVVPDLGRKIFSEQLSIGEFDDWYVTAGMSSRIRLSTAGSRKSGEP